MKIKNWGWVLAGLLIAAVLSGCNGKAQTPEAVAGEFWQAVIDQDMEKAKSLATWDTVDYLKYIRSGQLKPERYELGDVMKGDKNASIDTFLYSQKQGQTSVKIPGKTVLISTEHGWRVDLAETIGSTVQETVGTVFDQLNNLMQQGIQGLDKQLSESLNEVEKALQQGAEELRKELSKPPFNTEPSQPAAPPNSQRI